MPGKDSHEFFKKVVKPFRGTQREHSSKQLKRSIFKLILAFKR